MSRDAQSFEQLYRDLRDPWQYETSPYEADKYRRCLDLLPQHRYRRGLEIGCSIGVMSLAIAQRCDALLALDFAPTAVAIARQRSIPNARFEVGSVPQDWPSGRWDLIVLSELLYYLEEDALEETIRLVVRDLAPDGDCLVAGYTGETETRLTSQQANGQLLDALATARPAHSVDQLSGPSWIASVFHCRGGQRPSV